MTLVTFPFTRHTQSAPIATGPSYYGTGWDAGDSQDYDREHAVDLVQLIGFLFDTQPVTAGALDLYANGPTRQRFLVHLQGEITKHGVIDVLCNGIKHQAHHIDLFYGAPTPGNQAAFTRFTLNRFSVTRQLRYSRDETQLAGICNKSVSLRT